MNEVKGAYNLTIKEGNTVVYPVRLGNSAYLRLGVVKKITEEGCLKINAIIDDGFRKPYWKLVTIFRVSEVIPISDFEVINKLIEEQDKVEEN